MIKRKILHLSQPTGGVKTYVAHILDYADHNKYDFIIIAPENSFFEKECADRNIPYYRIDLHRGINPFQNISALFRIIRILRKEKPDIIHAHSAKGGFLGRIATRLTRQKKVLYTPHAFSYLPFTGFNRLVFFSLEVVARKWTTTLLAISHSEANRAIHELGYKRKNVKVVLNSIPVDLLKEHDRPVSFKPVLRINMIGRLTQQKNHLLFLEIADKLLKKYPNLQFSILGAGIHDELSADIYSYIESNGLTDSMKIEPWGDAATSRDFLQATDIFVMTSVFEGLPFSLLEAMSYKIPCVVSKVDGNTDVIHNNENGFSCLSADEFCSKIELLINNPQLRTSIGLKGYEYVLRHHSIIENIKLLEKIYDEI